jgi:hypothetical protein
MAEERVIVAVRVRSAGAESEHCIIPNQAAANTSLLLQDRPFSFDHVFWSQSKQVKLSAARVPAVYVYLPENKKKQMYTEPPFARIPTMHHKKKFLRHLAAACYETFGLGITRRCSLMVKRAAGKLTGRAFSIKRCICAL